MIPIKDIGPHIAGLSVGQQVNVNHDECPSGRDQRRRLYIRRTEHAVLAYCHNCNGHRVHRTNVGIRPLALLEKLVRDGDEAELVQQEVTLPEDATELPNEWDAKALSWLYQYDIDDTDILNHGICYSPSWGRVILPVYDGGKLVFWQGRVIEGDGPKYISVRSARKPVFVALAAPARPALPVNNIVLVEDYVSAIRVAKSGAGDALALLGTDGPDDLPSRLSGYARILVWLDKDHAGRSKAQPLYQRLRVTTNARVARADAPEPKRLTDKEIRGTVIDAIYK